MSESKQKSKKSYNLNPSLLGLMIGAGWLIGFIVTNSIVIEKTSYDRDPWLNLSSYKTTLEYRQGFPFSIYEISYEISEGHKKPMSSIDVLLESDYNLFTALLNSIIPGAAVSFLLHYIQKEWPKNSHSKKSRK